jgi:hypothetical protein
MFKASRFAVSEKSGRICFALTLFLTVPGQVVAQQSSPTASAVVSIDPNSCTGSTQIGKYKHCLIVPPTLALTDEQFKAIAQGPDAIMDAIQCTKIGGFHRCPIAPPTALELTKEQFNSLTKSSNE